MSTSYLILSNEKINTFSMGDIFPRNKPLLIPLSNSFYPKQQGGISYAMWQKLLKRFVKCIGRSRHPSYSIRRRKLTRRYRRFLQAKARLRNEIAEQQTIEIIKHLETAEVESSTKIEVIKEEFRPEIITMLKLFLERKHFSRHVEQTIPDHRNQELITYTKQSIMMAALTIFLLRMESGNAYDVASHDVDDKYAKSNIAKFIDAPEDRAPVIKTLEKFMKRLDEKALNNLMIAFFKDLLKSKFFKQQPELMPGDFFLLAGDCVHLHTYDHPHHVDSEGNNDCPFCLKRVYNKGTEKETIRWLHTTLVFTFVFFGGLKIPVYRHPIHARQLSEQMEFFSEDSYKQECEIVALKTALPVIREAFPRMKLVLNLDGLYANRPVIRLLKKFCCGYIIVRKEKCFPTLGKHCDKLSELPTYKKNCVKKTKMTEDQIQIERKYEWFNGTDLGDSEGDLKTNVLRFHEKRMKNGEVLLNSKGKPEQYQCEWLFSWMLSAKNCQLAIEQARLRWEEEDLFNTLKNRGFNLRHDYSRSPHSLFNWQGLSLFAFGIFELFRFSEAVEKRVDLAQVNLVKKLHGQLFHRPTEEIFPEAYHTIRIQFRYNFAEKVARKDFTRRSDHQKVHHLKYKAAKNVPKLERDQTLRIQRILKTA